MVYFFLRWEMGNDVEGGGGVIITVIFLTQSEIFINMNIANKMIPIWFILIWFTVDLVTLQIWT